MGKLIKIIVITLILIFIAINTAYAFNPDDYNPNKNPIQQSDYDETYKKAGVVLGFIRNIGAIVSVLGIATLGLRYMWGSLEQKANYKETMFPFMVGIAVTVGITTIITIVQKVAEKI